MFLRMFVSVCEFVEAWPTTHVAEESTQVSSARMYA